MVGHWLRTLTVYERYGMSGQQEVQAPQPERTEEVTKKASVYELPSLPVEFPPKDDEEGDQPRKIVTFEVEMEVKT